VVLFDEPLSTLDSNLREKMRFELVNLVKEVNITVLYVTHDQIEAMSMSNKIIIMNKGNILQGAEPEAIYNNCENKFVAEFIGKINILDEGFIRPEDISLTKSENSIEYKGTVEHISYMGNCYEIVIKMPKGVLWKIYTNQKVKLGEEFKLYIKNSDIHILGGNKNVQIK